MDLITSKVKDKNGIEHTFTVHPAQKPLPFYYDQLPTDLIHFFQSSDYAIETDPKKVESLLISNLEQAMQGVCAGGKRDVELGIVHPLTAEQGSVALQDSKSDQKIFYTTEYQVGIASTIGNRLMMEDEELVKEISVPSLTKKKILCVGVFDGHGGRACAKFMSEHFTDSLVKWLDDPILAKQERSLRIYNALILTFADLNRSFDQPSGTTASVALRIDRELWIANLGDARTILVTPRTTVQLTEDQKPNVARFGSIIEGRGGVIFEEFEEGGIEVIKGLDGVDRYFKRQPFFGLEELNYKPNSCARIYQPLQMGRIETLSPGGSLGDHTIMGAMNPHPVMTRCTLPSRIRNWFLVLTCDGVYEGLSSKMVAEVVKKSKKLSTAAMAVNVVQNAYNAGSNDNLSALVVPLIG